VSDLDAWLEDYRPYIATVRVCGRADLIAEHARRDAEMQAAVAESADMLASTAVDAARAAVDAVEAEIAASEKEFTFQGLGNKEWQDLKRAHPPTQAQREERLDTNMEAFAPALIAASSLAPKISPAQALTMMDRFPIGEFEKLFQGALEANGQVAGPPKSVMAALIGASRQNGGYSTTPAPEVSPEASSSDDNGSLSGEQSGTTSTD
jgi:hypothetical protein